MVKIVGLGTSVIVPKGLLGYYITPLFWIFEEKYVEPFVHFDKHTFYKMCRKDWDWGKTVLTDIMKELQSLIDERLKDSSIIHLSECEIIYAFKTRIREIRDIFTEKAVERPLYAYVEIN